MDNIILQCRFYRSPTSGHRRLRSVRIRTNTRPVPAAIRPRAEKCLLHEDSVLALGRQCIVSQSCECHAETLLLVTNE